MSATFATIIQSDPALLDLVPRVGSLGLAKPSNYRVPLQVVSRLDNKPDGFVWEKIITRSRRATGAKADNIRNKDSDRN